MKLQYNRKVCLIACISVVVTMTFLGYKRQQYVEYERSNTLTQLMTSVSQRVGRTVAPSIWALYQKSVDRHFSNEAASSLLDLEVEETAIRAIVINGNFGHVYMGRFKNDAGEIIPFERERHESLLSHDQFTRIRQPIKQGSMTIGQVVVYYKPDLWLYSSPSFRFLSIIDLIAFTALLLALLCFALRSTQARESAENSSKVKSQFLANMSHEIRTPLNAILGMLELLERDELNSTQRDNVNVISHSSKSLLGIVNDILDIAKIEAEKVDIELADFNVEKLMDSLYLAFRELANQKNIDLIFRIDELVPAIINADEMRVRQILTNLISNAIKFTDQGKVEVSVSVVTDATASLTGSEVKLLFCVRDTGVGIDAEYQDKLFQPFNQAEVSTTRRYGGTGLGLAISGRLADMMGGTISFESRAGEGSTFNYTQPLNVISRDQVPTDENAGGQQTLYQEPGAVKADENKILVVEDNSVNKLVLKKQLASLGYVASFANNGQEGLAAWEQGDFALIFTDCQMPVMDGYQMTRAIRQKESVKTQSQTPIIAITASAMTHEREQCLAAGMNVIISKPYGTAELDNVLQQYLSA